MTPPTVPLSLYHGFSSMKSVRWAIFLKKLFFFAFWLCLLETVWWCLLPFVLCSGNRS
jgi:hypothetical protein